MCSLSDVEHPEKYAEESEVAKKYFLGSMYKRMDNVDYFIENMKAMYSGRYY